MESYYESTSTIFILIRIVRFYQLTILPTVRITRLFLNRRIVDQNRDFNNNGLNIILSNTYCFC